ncbi:hypothetical protein DENSPDRAFT_881736 [Dentipellis sp. KUC8613]|nr:hypothetical protein DENSPDRAFT_881736 [Dentipellis sp. KUC8613]
MPAPLRLLRARADSLRTTTTANNLRIASLSIALYDYVHTLPAEWRYYRNQPKPFRLSTGLVLFVLIRYVSIVVLVVSNVGFFSHSFTQASCHRFYMAAPVLKVIQTMVSQAILGFRAWNISRRSRLVGLGILGGGLVITGLEWFTNLYHRIPVSTNASSLHARETNSDPDNELAVWLFYLLSMVYDLVTLSVSTLYLIKYRPHSSAMSHLIRVMLYDGLWYFVVLTGSNVLNVILYRGNDESLQSSGASLGYAVTWIMSQRILIHIRDATTTASPTREILTQQLQSSHQISGAMRTQRMGKGRFDSAPDDEELDMTELSVQVRVERSVVMDAPDREREGQRGQEAALYAAPKVMWESRPRS